MRGHTTALDSLTVALQAVYVLFARSQRCIYAVAWLQAGGVLCVAKSRGPNVLRSGFEPTPPGQRPGPP